MSTRRRFASHACWRSGFFDGDGSVFLRASSQSFYPNLGIGASLSADTLSALDEFRSVYGGIISESHARTLRNAKHMPVCQWNVRGSAVFTALQDLLSGLIIKRPQGELVLAQRHLYQRRAHHRLSSVIIEARSNLRDRVRSVRAAEFQLTASEYRALISCLCPHAEQQFAYAAGFCDAEAYFGCLADNRGTYRYRVTLSQKNRGFLEAFKQVILEGRGSNVWTSSSGQSTLHICAATQVLQFCRQIQPFSIVKWRQLDIITSCTPGAAAREALMGMHGNQGKKQQQQTTLANDPVRMAAAGRGAVQGVL